MDCLQKFKSAIKREAKPQETSGNPAKTRKKIWIWWSTAIPYKECG